MVATPILGLHLPFGTEVATANASLGFNDRIRVTNPPNVVVGQTIRLHNGDTTRTPKEQTNFTVTAVTPVGGSSDIFFTPNAAAPTVALDRVFVPEIPNVTTAISNQFSQLDGQIQCVEVADNTARDAIVPPQRFTGMIVFVNSTGLLQWWNGAAWQNINDPSAALGVTGVNITNPNIAIPANSDQLFASQTMSMSTGRLYLVRWNVTVGLNTLANAVPIGAKFRIAPGATITTATSPSFITRCDYYVSPSGSFDRIHHAGFFLIQAPSSGQNTLGLFLARLADGIGGSSAGFLNTNFSVEDIGAA